MQNKWNHLRPGKWEKWKGIQSGRPPVVPAFVLFLDNGESQQRFDFAVTLFLGPPKNGSMPPHVSAVHS